MYPGKGTVVLIRPAQTFYERIKFSIYSLGMKHRLGIAYALLGDPELLLLDEPTNGLDPAGMVEVRALIRDLGAAGRTILLCSHLLNEVEQVCDSVAILSHGRLIIQGSVPELLGQQGEFRLRTTDDAEATQIINSVPWVAGIRMEDGYLIVTAAVDRAWELTKALSEQGIYVSELVAVQASLEEYFLEVTDEETSSGQKEAR